jgi:hypothetical protein
MQSNLNCFSFKPEMFGKKGDGIPMHLSEFFSVLESIKTATLQKHMPVFVTCMSCLGKYYEVRCRTTKALYFTISCTLLVRLASKDGLYYHIDYEEKRFKKEVVPFDVQSTAHFIQKVAKFLQTTKLPLICFTDAEKAKSDIFTRWTLPSGLT